MPSPRLIGVELTMRRAPFSNNYTKELLIGLAGGVAKFQCGFLLKRVRTKKATLNRTNTLTVCGAGIKVGSTSRLSGSSGGPQ
jgi:hypothetical protein